MPLFQLHGALYYDTKRLLWGNYLYCISGENGIFSHLMEWICSHVQEIGKEEMAQNLAKPSNCIDALIKH